MTIVIMDIILCSLSALGMRKVTCKTSTASRVLDKAKKKLNGFVGCFPAFFQLNWYVNNIINNIYFSFHLAQEFYYRKRKKIEEMPLLNYSYTFSVFFLYFSSSIYEN